MKSSKLFLAITVWGKIIDHVIITDHKFIFGEKKSE